MTAGRDCCRLALYTLVMTVADTGTFAGLVASIASLILALLAIWLTLEFYKRSTDALRQIDIAAQEIKAGGKRLEALFETMYSDTWSAFRESYVDIREHAWPAHGGVPDLIEERTDAKVAELREETAKQIESALAQATDPADADRDVQQLVRTAFDGVRNAEMAALQETTRETILRTLTGTRDSIHADSLVESLRARGLSARAVVRELERMRDEGLLTWDTDGSPDRYLAPTSEITVT